MVGGRAKHNMKVNGKTLAKKPSKKNKIKKKKRDVIHGVKAGEKGSAAQYITRAQALTKLNIPLADFRKLCILKGIFPREPKKKNQGTDKTYYHKKDITFLTHEPLLAKFFELKMFLKRFKKALGRSERDRAKGIADRKPVYTLHHLVRERYHSFQDAIRDLDDAVSMLALFQVLSPDQRKDIPPAVINEATTLYQEFQLYIIRAQALRKVFASIKGYYFQADIAGHTVTWLAPHHFAQELPDEVDFKVMLTFLEFYSAMLKFVNYKLYADLGLSYPPKRVEKRDQGGAEVSALESDMKEAGKAREAQAEAEKNADAEVSNNMAADFGAETEEAQELQKRAAEQTRMKTTFRGMKAFINREVPLRPVYFVLLCGGVDEVGWERGAHEKFTGSAYGVTGKRITHQIVDRPPDTFETRPGREYMQPQWVFDSFNTGAQLPVALYAPGRAPPPHLSPFVDDKAEGYVPRQRELLDKLASEAQGMTPVLTKEDGKEETAQLVETATPFDQFSKELKAESEGVWHSSFAEKQKEEQAERARQILEDIEADAAAEVASGGVKPKEALINPNLVRMEEALHPPKEAGAKPTEEEEEHLRARALMTAKNKRLLSKIEFSAKEKDDKINKLKKRRTHLEAQDRKAKQAAEEAENQ